MLYNDYKISDLNMYLNQMQKSVLDKMFFIDKVFDPFSNIVDFGCANGDLIKSLRLLFGQYRYIGYDISEEMISEARVNVPSTEFYSDWKDLQVDFSDSLVNISSTLHEVYSYCTREEIDEFWGRIFGSGFKYVAIREMVLSEVELTRIDTDQHETVRKNGAYADRLKDYERIWGPIASQRDLIHFLLKYQYGENWAREVRENYIPVTLEQLLGLIPDQYEVTYLNHFTLPYTVWQLQKDFGITLTTPTHIKLILRRKDESQENANG